MVSIFSLDAKPIALTQQSWSNKYLLSALTFYMTEAADSSWPCARIVEMYGSTETAGIASREHPGAFQLLKHWTRRADGMLVDGYSDHRLVAVPDRVEWLDERRFSLIGRIDRIVKIAGERVDLDDVEAHILQFPGVTSASVRPTSAPIPRLKALLAPALLAGHMDELRDHVSRLSAPARLKSWSFRDDWPRSEMGKEIDWE